MISIFDMVIKKQSNEKLIDSTGLLTERILDYKILGNYN